MRVGTDFFASSAIAKTEEVIGYDISSYDLIADYKKRPFNFS